MYNGVAAVTANRNLICPQGVCHDFSKVTYRRALSLGEILTRRRWSAFLVVITMMT